MEIRTFERADGPAMRAFSERLPAEDRNFFKEDVLEPGVLERWVQDTASRRAVAVDGQEIIGYVAVHPLSGWSRHVAELRVIVQPGGRGRGFGKALVRRGLQDAWDLGCTKIVVEAASEQDATIGMLQMLGFEPEALLRAHVRDRGGALRDLLVLAHHVDENWEALSTLGLPDALNASQ